jgi:hypothetical protein
MHRVYGVDFERGAIKGLRPASAFAEVSVDVPGAGIDVTGHWRRTAAWARRRWLPTPRGAAPERILHRQAVRHEWPTLIHATSGAPLSAGSLHPSILKARGLNSVASVGDEAGSGGSAGTMVVNATPVTKFRRSIIMPPLLRACSIAALAHTTVKTRTHCPIVLWPRTEARTQPQRRQPKSRSCELVQSHEAWADCRH